jgi:hypothetical protein
MFFKRKEKVEGPAAPQDYKQALAEGKIAFIDFGSGFGDSIDCCEKAFGLGDGIGFDKSKRKFEGDKKAHSKVHYANIIDLELPKQCVKFCTMMDFLEHLPHMQIAKDMLNKAQEWADEFIFIRHPSFEDIDYLAQFGLKLDWTDWKGHSNMMTMDDFRGVFEEFGWKEYCIIPRRQILSSQHKHIVPISAPTDTTAYNAAEHGKKAIFTFQKPVYAQFDLFIKLNPELDHQTWLERIKAPGVMALDPN